MGATPVYGIHFPEGGDAYDPTEDMKDLALSTEAALDGVVTRVHESTVSWERMQQYSGGGLGTAEWLLTDPVSVTAPFGPGVPYVIEANYECGVTMPGGYGYYFLFRFDGVNAQSPLRKAFNYHPSLAIQVWAPWSRQVWRINDNATHTIQPVFQSPDTAGASLIDGSKLVVIARAAKLA